MIEQIKAIKLPQHGLSSRQRLIFYRQLKRMLRITSLTEALIEIRKRSKESRSGAGRARACDIMIDGVSRNKTMGESLTGIIPSSESIILLVGERNGRLNESLDSLIYILEAQSGVTSAIVGAVTYPSVLFLVVIGMYIGFESSMLPIIATMAKPETWPENTRLAASIARFISDYWWALIAGFGGVLFALFRSMPKWTGDFRDTLDNYPVYGTYRSLQAAIFMLALSSMQKSGSPLDESIKEIRTLSTPWMTRHLDTMLFKLKKERQAGDAIDVGLIPPDLMSDIKIATQAGDLDEALEELGKEAINDFKDHIKLLTVIISPVGLVFVAGNIALIGLAYLGATMPS